MAHRNEGKGIMSGKQCECDRCQATAMPVCVALDKLEEADETIKYLEIEIADLKSDRVKYIDIIQKTHDSNQLHLALIRELNVKLEGINDGN